MTQKPRRVFTDEQKAESVRIVNQSGKPVSRVAKEVGVWAFVDAQHYSPSYQTAAWLAHCLYPLVIPHRYRPLRAIEQQSRRLGQQADCIIAHPLEDYWSEPLAPVRSRLGLA